MDRVAPVALAYALDADVHPTLRRKAAEILDDVPSKAIRAKLVDWLVSDAAAAGGGDLADESALPTLLREIAIRAVAPGDGPAAQRCLQALRRRIDETFADDRSLDPTVPREFDPADDVASFQFSAAGASASPGGARGVWRTSLKLITHHSSFSSVRHPHTPTLFSSRFTSAP